MTQYRRALYTAPGPLSPALPGDAGIDLACSEVVHIYPGEWKNIPCDIHMAFPPNVFGLVMARSSTFFKKHLMVNTAVIDEGYTGPLFTAVYNIGTRRYDVEVGERLAQIILMPRIVDQVELEWLDRDSFYKETEGRFRADAGFGSTG